MSAPATTPADGPAEARPTSATGPAPAVPAPAGPRPPAPTDPSRPPAPTDPSRPPAPADPARPADPGAGPGEGPTAPAPEPARSRWLRQARRLREAPLTLGLLAALWIIGAATGSLRHGPSGPLLEHVGVGLPTLDAGRWWTPLTSLVWCSGLSAYAFTSLLLLLVGPVAERRLGRRRSVLVLVVGQVVATLLGTALVRLGIAAGEGWTLDIADQIATGPGVGLFGLAAVLGYRLTALWRRRMHLLVVLVPLVATLYIGHLQGLQRFTAAVVGLLVGGLLHRPGAHRDPAADPDGLRRRRRLRLRRRGRPSHNETRVLVALCLVAAAVGPLFASLYDNAIGPFNSLSDLYLSRSYAPDEIADLCSISVHECARAHAVQDFFDSPGRLMAAAVPALLLVLAEGLRRGLRAAWRITVLTELIWICLLGRLLADDLSVLQDPADTAAVVEFFVEALLLPVLTTGLLIRTRHRFQLRMGRRVVRRLAAVIATALVLTATAYVGVGALVREQYDPAVTTGRLVAGLPAAYLPPAYAELLSDYPIATGPVARLLVTYCGLLFWTVTLSALLVALRRPVVHVDAEDAARARALLTAHGGSTLSFISTWDGNHYWFDEAGEAAVPYRVLSTVALTTGDPFGEPEARRRAVAGFARYCDARGWTPCFYSVTPEIREAAAELGWRSLQVAEDTVVALPELAFTGKKWQDIRTSLNKAGKQGIVAEWWSYRDAPADIKDQIRSISEEWVCDKGLPEMGFTLGGLDELEDPAVRVLIAVDPERQVHGLTSWMPVYEDGRPVGWTLDFMRRGSDGFRGVMEFLIASAALGFKEEGARFLSLSGAPLARADRGQDPTSLQRMLDWMGKVLEPVYGFRSLLAFKAKFQPEYRPLFMVYPDPAALPSITRAIGKAYLPHLTAAQGVRLMRKLSA
ncbi:bifunctional lysylphosphatidylglycerol flippase/synthetase MprF [Kitasatospora indigofera]|uniref:bifunctional lysylphosphatidylglycerol flippase/synthetase MprF n=1 Tax=Kitasatospora indigofera TaxID=67307 RepID=UPI003667C40A